MIGPLSAVQPFKHPLTLSSILYSIKKFLSKISNLFYKWCESHSLGLSYQGFRHVYITNCEQVIYQILYQTLLRYAFGFALKLRSNYLELKMNFLEMKLNYLETEIDLSWNLSWIVDLSWNGIELSWNWSWTILNWNWTILKLKLNSWFILKWNLTILKQKLDYF